MNIKNKKNRLVKIVLPTLAILVIASIAGTWLYFNKKDNGDVKRDATGTSLERSKNEEAETTKLNDTPESKEANNSDTPPAPATNPETGLNEANVILTNTGVGSDGTVDASGFVSNVVEDTGTCTFVFTRDDKVVRKSSTTTTNPSSTTCKTVRFNKAELAVGKWSVLIEYVSPTSKGVSNTGEVTIQ